MKENQDQNKGIEQEALNFLAELSSVYFESRDLEQLPLYMQERTSWIGTGVNEISHNLAEAQQALINETAEYNGKFLLSDTSFKAVALSDIHCVVYGVIKAVPDNPGFSEDNLCFSVVVEKTNDGLKLVHMHFSHSDQIQEQGHYFVTKRARHNNNDLRLALDLRERQLAELTKNIPGGAHQCLNDTNLTLVSMSDEFLDMFGYTQEEIRSIFGGRFINMIYPGDRDAMLKSIYKQMKSRSDIELEYRVLCKVGPPVWVLDKCRLVKRENGDSCFYCLLIENTDRKREQEELRLSLERHRIILDQTIDIIFEWNIIADTLDFSANWNKKFGYDPINRQISKKIPLSENIHPEDIPAFVGIMRDTAAGIPYSETEFRIRDILGQYQWNRIRATAQFDSDGHAIKAVGVITDISAEKTERLALIEQAQKDALTGLYNKSAIKLKVEQQMRESCYSDTQALLIIDVDHFKQVNDTYGHLCGDTILSDIAELLKSHFRATDLIGRIGGDEFMVYMSAVKDESTVQNRVNSMLADLAQIAPFPDAACITCSVGAAVFPREDMDYFTLYQAADRALYHQKNGGRNGISFYKPSFSDSGLSEELIHSSVSDSIDSEQNDMVEEKLSQYVFHMLYKSTDLKMAVNRLLEIVGRAYNVSRVYIFESSADGLVCNNTFEWCAAGIPSEIDKLQGIRYEEDLGGYLQNFDEDGVFYCRDITTLKKCLYNVLAPQGIRSLLQCAVMDKRQFKGYVGFDECKENCLWNKEQIRSLTLIANVLSVFLIKLRLEEQFEKQKDSAGGDE